VLTDARSFLFGSVCKVNTQDPENFDEELKSLVTAWLTLPFFLFSLCQAVLTKDQLLGKDEICYP
jgi:hypothetical protein